MQGNESKSKEIIFRIDDGEYESHLNPFFPYTTNFQNLEHEDQVKIVNLECKGGSRSFTLEEISPKFLIYAPCSCPQENIKYYCENCFGICVRCRYHYRKVDLVPLLVIPYMKENGCDKTIHAEMCVFCKEIREIASGGCFYIPDVKEPEVE